MKQKPLRDQLHPKALEQLRNYVEKIVDKSELYVSNPTFNARNSIKLPEEEFHALAKLLLKQTDFMNILDIKYILKSWLVELTDELDLPGPGPGGLCQVHPLDSSCSVETLNHMTNTVFDNLISLPHEYQILIPIMIDDYIDFTFPEPIKISEDISLFVMTDIERNSEFPAIDTSDSPYDAEGHHPPVGYLYISMTKCGCTSFSSWSFLYKSCIKTLNLLLSALIVNEVIYVNWRNDTSDPPDDDSVPPGRELLAYGSDWGPGYVYLYPRDTLRKPSYRKLDNKQRVILRSLTFSSVDEDISELDKTKMKKANAHSQPALSKVTDEVLARVMNMKIRNIQKIFNSGDSEAERVKTALEWYSAGLLNENRTFSYVQYAIALEALFGDSKQRSNILERISDRCSFVLAQVSPERMSIKSDIDKIYDVRSRIVHTGNQKLNENDSGCYSNLKMYLEKALAKEMEYLP